MSPPELLAELARVERAALAARRGDLLWLAPIDGGGHKAPSIQNVRLRNQHRALLEVVEAYGGRLRLRPRALEVSRRIAEVLTDSRPSRGQTDNDPRLRQARRSPLAAAVAVPTLADRRETCVDPAGQLVRSSTRLPDHPYSRGSSIRAVGAGAPTLGRRR